jgi:hypothetical protein
VTGSGTRRRRKSELPALGAGIGLLLSVFGCADDEAAAVHAFCPLPSGARWEYSVVTAGPTGEMSGGLTSRVDGEKTINGRRYTRLINTPSGSGEGDTFYFRATAEGVFFVRQGQNDYPEQLYLPARPRVGESWTVATPTTHMRNRVEGFEDVELPSGRYENCLKVASSGTILSGLETISLDGITHYAPGVGQIKSEMIMTGESGEEIPIRIALTDFST